MRIARRGSSLEHTYRRGAFMNPANEIDSGVAGIIAHIGDADFPARLTETVQSIVPFQSSLFMGCEKSRAPQLLHDGLGEDERAIFSGAYMGGAYLLAPGYRAAQDAAVSGVCRLSEVFPGEMETSQYFSVYWGQTGMIDELFLFVRLEDGRATYLALGRYEGAGLFSDEDIRHLEIAEPVFREAIRRHWRDRSFGVIEPVKPDSGHERVRRLLTEFGSGNLTPREYEVCQLMLHGHSSKSGARELGISPETERIHRGRVFQKLGVTSQVETLALFLQSLSEKHPDNGGAQ